MRRRPPPEFARRQRNQLVGRDVRLRGRARRVARGSKSAGQGASRPVEGHKRRQLTMLLARAAIERKKHLVLTLQLTEEPAVRVTPIDRSVFAATPYLPGQHKLWCIAPLIDVTVSPKLRAQIWETVTGIRRLLLLISIIRTRPDDFSLSTKSGAPSNGFPPTVSAEMVLGTRVSGRIPGSLVGTFHRNDEQCCKRSATGGRRSDVARLCGPALRLARAVQS
jgi:hypothetical protein